MFKWRDEFSVNVEEIDTQHKKLFEIGNKLYELVSLSDSDTDYYDKIIGILNELENYTIYHFETEERLMKEYGYKFLDEHEIEHIFFIKKIQKISKKDIDVEQKETLLEMIAFVADWVTTHILKTDMKYKEFFNKKGLY